MVLPHNEAVQIEVGIKYLFAGQRQPRENQVAVFIVK
jgi:hypothetical protein